MRLIQDITHLFFNWQETRALPSNGAQGDAQLWPGVTAEMLAKGAANFPEQPFIQGV